MILFIVYNLIDISPMACHQNWNKTHLFHLNIFIAKALIVYFIKRGKFFDNGKKYIYKRTNLYHSNFCSNKHECCHFTMFLKFSNSDGLKNAYFYFVVQDTKKFIKSLFVFYVKIIISGGKIYEMRFRL